MEQNTQTPLTNKQKFKKILSSKVVVVVGTVAGLFITSAILQAINPASVEVNLISDEGEKTSIPTEAVES